mmetsp:Transcript_6101/g.15588  ORF Transcript_6101/g.15588 Transcript_6101/m.15588 type:complete len:367 (-) Transcript_6101:193-1293(-)
MGCASRVCFGSPRGFCGLIVVVTLMAAQAAAMNKAELIDAIADDAGISKADAKRALDAFVDTTTIALKKKGDRVALVGFGSFSISSRRRRAGRSQRIRRGRKGGKPAGGAEIARPAKIDGIDEGNKPVKAHLTYDGDEVVIDVDLPVGSYDREIRLLFSTNRRASPGVIDLDSDGFPDSRDDLPLIDVELPEGSLGSPPADSAGDGESPTLTIGFPPEIFTTDRASGDLDVFRWVASLVDDTSGDSCFPATLGGQLGARISECPRGGGDVCDSEAQSSLTEVIRDALTHAGGVPTHRTVTATIDSLTRLAQYGKQNEANLIGFGTFSISKRAARTGRNPQTGKEIKIAAKNVVKFKAGKALSDKLN